MSITLDTKTTVKLGCHADNARKRLAISLDFDKSTDTATELTLDKANLAVMGWRTRSLSENRDPAANPAVWPIFQLIFGP